ncbi:ABC transporter permease [Leucobacter aridicollis]|uniref:Ribose transport system permease protein n=1 Tax=Leucobacter aridicollis TaxID=283878 RepID=A0A852R4Q1_9MICO|nr:ABC transporter permease [Leucobacter aridicollis]MBL3681244.1 ABC transporter permease [Leucobacter aridicollis]NYD27737.1 ribose transport system permease protein [Leucobacter aridicollis]
MNQSTAVRTPSTESVTTPPSFDSSEPSAARRLLTSTAFLIAVVVVALILLFGLLSPNGVFLGPANFRNLALDSAQLILLAVGMTFLVGAGELDLSIGANVILSSVVAAKVITWLGGSPEAVLAGEYTNALLAVLAGVAAAIGTGLLFGFINALLVNTLRVNSFIVTLAMMSVGSGLAYIVTNGVNVSSLPREMQKGFGSADFIGIIPIPALLALVVGAIAWYTMTKLRFGAHTLGMGSSLRAAERAGVNVRRQRIKLFLIMGGICGLVGFIDIARFLTTNIQGHQGDALAAIAAVVIGGTSLFGGRASVPGSMIAAIIPAVLINGLVILRVGSFYQLVVTGAILLIAVGIDQRRRAQQK